LPEGGKVAGSREEIREEGLTAGDKSGRKMGGDLNGGNRSGRGGHSKGFRRKKLVPQEQPATEKDAED